MASNQHIAYTFSIENDNFNQKIQAMNKEIKTFENEIKQSSNEVLKSGKNLETLGNKYTAINKSLDKAKEKVEEYEKQIEKQNLAIQKSKDKLIELGKKKDEINKKYDESVKATGKESEATLKLKEELDKLNQKYKNAEKSITSKEKALQNYGVSLAQAKTKVSDLEVELKKCSDAIEEQGNKFVESSKKFTEVGTSFEKVGGNISSLGENVAKAGALITTAGVALGKMAMDAEKDLATLGGRLGVTTEEAENLKQVAKDLYNGGFGESLSDCVNDVVLLQQNIKETSNMTDEQKGKLLEQISTIKTLFGAESQELTRALNNMLKNGVIDNIQEGLDLITVGFQNGLNSGGDLLEILYQYSPQFKKFGIDGQSALEMVKAGLDAGGYNADKMGDALKELSIRVIDGSDTTKEGFELMGKNAEEMARKFAAGGETAKEALKETIEGLKNIQDPLEQDLAGVDLFGTMWEDSSKEAILAMGNIGVGLGDITNATQKAGEEVNNTFEKKFTSSIRKLQTSLIPLGEALLPVVDGFVEGIDDVTSVISKLDPELIKSIATFGAMSIAFGTVTKATGSLVSVLGKGATGISTLLKIAGDTKELGSLTKALGNSDTAIGTLIKSVGGLKTGVGLLTSGSLLPIVGVLATVTAGVYAYNKGQEAINKTVAESKGEYTGLEKVMASLMGVQLRSREELEKLGLVYKDFNENISEEFQNSVKEMTTDIHEFGLSLGDVTLDGVFTEEEANSMTSRVDSALKSTLSAIESKSQEMQDGLGKAFGVDGIIDENESVLIEYWNSRGTKEKEEAQNLQNEINNIILAARNEGRNLTSEEEAKIREYYAQIKQIELEALASNSYEIEYATQEFKNRIKTMDAESAKELLGQRYEEYNEQQIAIQTNYDTLIAMAQENYENLSEEEKKKVNETVTRLEESKTKELEINKQKYDEALKDAYEHNENLRTEFNRFTGELVAEKDRAYYEEYEQMMTHYEGIESITESGYKKVYDTATGTWKDLYVAIDEATGQIKGVYDLNTMNVFTMNKNDERILRDEVAVWNQTSAGILANALIIGNAYVDASGQITNASGVIIGKLGQVKNANGELVDAILDVNGNPINIGENTESVIKNLKETQTQVKNTNGMKAQIIVTDDGTISDIQTKINNISGKQVVVGVVYDESGKPYWNGSTMYAAGTQGTPTDQVATVNEGSTWELVDAPNGKEAYSLGKSTQGELAYLPKNTRVTTALASTQKMKIAVREEVNRQLNSSTKERAASNNSTSSKSTKSQVSNIDDLTDRYYELERAVKNYSNTLERVKLLQEGYDDKENINLMKQEIELYKKKAEAVKKLNEEQTKEALELKNSLYNNGFRFDLDGNIINRNEEFARKVLKANSMTNDEEKEIYISYIRDMEDYVKRYDELVTSLIPKQEQEWNKLANSIKDVQAEILDIMEETVEEMVNNVENSINEMIKNTDKEISKMEFNIDITGGLNATNTTIFKAKIIQLQKDKIKELNKALEELNKIIPTTEAQQESLNERIEETKDQITEAEQELRKLAGAYEEWGVELLYTPYRDKMWQTGTQQMNKVDLEMQTTEDTDTSKRIELMKKKLELQKTMVEETGKYLQKLRNTTTTTTEGYQALIEKIKEAEEELYNQESAFNSLNKELEEFYKDKLNTVADVETQISDLIKKEAEERIEQEKKVLEESLEADKKRLESKKKALQEEQKLYQQQYKEEDYNAKLNEERNKLLDIQAEIDKLQWANDRASQEKLASLMKEYSEQQKVINDMIKENQHEAINDRFEQEQEMIDKELEDKQEAYEKAVEELNKKLENFLTPDNLTNLVSAAINTGLVNVMGDTVELNNAMKQMLKDSEVGVANLNIQFNTWLEQVNSIKDVVGDIGSLINNAGLQDLSASLSKSAIPSVDINSLSRAIKEEMSYLSRNIGIEKILEDAQKIELSNNNQIYEVINSLAKEMNRSKSISIDMGGINIEGNVTKEVLPDIERMLKRQKDEIYTTIARKLGGR